MIESVTLVNDDPIVERARGRVGSLLEDKWRLDALLGVGGMAAVYAATHRNGARAAVKVLHIELSADPEIRNRLMREGYVANKVDHPGAVRVLDDDIAEDGSAFLVMELVEGETLTQHWERKDRALGLGDVLCAINQVLDVLAVAHTQGIIHRDVKPDNVFICQDGTIKLLDFGVARLRELSSSAQATRTGHTMGTPAYMPPEQARGRWDELDARSDVWAVGATMFKLLTGRVVHQADTINEQLLAAMTQIAEPIATFLPNLPIPVVEVVDKALAFDKKNRWDSAKVMQDAVRAAHEAVLHAPVPAALAPFDLAKDGKGGGRDAKWFTRNGATVPAVARELSKWLRPAGAQRSRNMGTMVVLAFGVGTIAGMGLWMARSGQAFPSQALEDVGARVTKFVAEAAGSSEGTGDTSGAATAGSAEATGGAGAALDPATSGTDPLGAASATAGGAAGTPADDRGGASGLRTSSHGAPASTPTHAAGGTHARPKSASPPHPATTTAKHPPWKTYKH